MIVYELDKYSIWTGNYTSDYENHGYEFFTLIEPPSDIPNEYMAQLRYKTWVIISEIPESDIERESSAKINEVDIEINKRINNLRWRLDRHYDENILGIAPTENIAPLLLYIKALRDIPSQEEYPFIISWPELDDYVNSGVSYTGLGNFIDIMFNNMGMTKNKWLSYNDIPSNEGPYIVLYDSKLINIITTNKNENVNCDIKIFKNENEIFSFNISNSTQHKQELSNIIIKQNDKISILVESDSKATAARDCNVIIHLQLLNIIGGE